MSGDQKTTSGSQSQSPATRLHCVLARKAHVGVVFRRGPSKQVLLLRWRTDTHELEAGQWLKGRIYERRCDVSPSGDKLVYFAGNHKPPLYTWTAVSRPPYLTALALWPKGDTWGGGGVFRGERTLHLDHCAGPQMEPGAGSRIPGKFRVEVLSDHAASAGIEPLWTARMLRDGWEVQQWGSPLQQTLESEAWYTFAEPQVLTKAHRDLVLETRLVGIKQTDGPWLVTEHRVTRRGGELVLDLGRSDWADWSLGGELLVARDGLLSRGRVVGSGRSDLEALEPLFDLRALRFEQVESPPEAKQWRGRQPSGRPIARFS